MKILLDTHTFIWWTDRPQKLSPIADQILNDRTNILFLSVVSMWEMQIKSASGKLPLPQPYREMVVEQVRVNGLLILPVYEAHVYALDQLPAHHNDPFDRLLIGQALDEQLSILTADSLIQKYSISTIW